MADDAALEEVDGAPVNLTGVESSCASGSARVHRGAVAGEWLGWSGSTAEASTKKIMTFYPGTDENQAFSQKKCHPTLAAVKPSLAFYAWLVASSLRGGPGWQLRGDVEFKEAVEFVPGLVVTSTSLWAGAGGTRTPLHCDNVHALIVQLAGVKRFFLATENSVGEAVENGRLPPEVLSDATTESFLVDGRLEDVHRETAVGALVDLSAGDCLVLPAGLYHDVECSGDPALSLTIRFTLPEKPTLQSFMRRLAVKKVAAVEAAARSKPDQMPPPAPSP